MKAKKIFGALVIVFATATLCHSQTVTGSFTFGGQIRSYRVYLPVNFNPSTSLPLMINLHGRGSNGQQQELYTGMNGVADTGRFVVVYPNAVTYQGDIQWNAFGLSATPDDKGFISALIDTMYARYNIDLSRVYATGLSSGGFMSYKLGCDLSCRIAAIAPVAGLLVNNPLAPCNLARPVALFHIHGTADAVVPYSGLPGVHSVPSTISQWRSKIACPGTPIITNLPNTSTSDGSTVIDSSYRPCNNSTEITLYAVMNGGHTWPGAIGPNTNQDFNASRTIWNFLKQYDIAAADLSISGLAPLYCEDAGAVTLTGSPSGGTFSGMGVSGSTFSPSSVNPGIYEVTYTRASGGCTYSVKSQVNVNSLPSAMASANPSSIVQGNSTTLTASGGVQYIWSNGETSGTFMAAPDSTTAYSVTVTDANGCSASAQTTVTVTNLPVGISESGERLSFALYPNPAFSTLNIEFPGENYSIENIEMFSVDGKKVLAMKALQSFSDRQVAIPLKDLNLKTGLYFVRLIGKDFAEGRRVWIEQ